MDNIKRVILKLSGEALAKKEGGYNDELIENIANQVKTIVDKGTDVGVVIGGGNYWRGRSNDNIDRTKADQIGMLATIMNSLALQNALEQAGVPTRCLSALEVQAVAEPYIRRRAIRHLEKGRVCIFAGGLGNPYFSTDTAAATRAIEIGADVVLMAKNGTEGVYDSDPRKNPNAKMYEELSFSEVLNKNLAVMDSTAASLCKDNGMKLIVFNMNKPGNIVKAVKGEHIGTLVKND